MNIIFFNSDINKFIESLDKSTHSKILRHLKFLETYGPQLTMPYSKPIAKNLFELRTKGQQEIRLFYCFYKNQIVILHGFIKKSQKTPPKEINLALKRISTLP